MIRPIAIILSAVLPFTLFAQPSPSWKIYYDSAQIYWGKDWQKTIPLLKRAEPSALSDLGIYDENYLTIINDLGLAYGKIGDYANAEKLLSKVLTIKTELNAVPDSELYRSINNLAGVHGDQRHYLQAEQLYKKVLSGYSSPGALDPAIYWSSARNLELLYEKQGQFDSALVLIDKLRIKQIGDVNQNLVAHHAMNLAAGRINRKLKKYDEAQIILESSGSELRNQQDPKLYTIYLESLQELGLLYAETGLYDKAEKNLLLVFRLLKIKQPVNNPLLIEVLNNLGSVYEKLGIYDKATVYYQDALDLSNHEYGESALSSTTLESNIAGIYLKAGNLEQAIKRYEAIVKILETRVSESGLFYPTVLNNLATAYRKNGQYRQATEHLERAYRLVQKNKLENDDLAATIMNNQAVLLTTLGQLNEALVYYEKAYTIKSTIYGNNSVLLMDLASNMAVVYWAQQKQDLAIPLFQKSISLALRQVKYIFPNLGENDQVQFYRKLKEDFERFSTIAFQLNRPDLLIQVFNNQVTIKSVLFFTQQHRRELITEKNDSTLNKQYEMLKAKREQLGLFYQLSLSELATAETTAGKLEHEVDALEKAISLKTSETVAEKMMEQGIQWGDLQSKIQPEEAVIDILRLRKYDLKTYVEQLTDRAQFGFTDSVYYAVLVTTSATTQHPQLILLKEGANMETRFLSYYRNALTYQVQDENSYEGYWKPFSAAIANKSKIYFSGDGVYHRLNLNTLRQPETGEFLIQRYDIHYLLNPGQYLEKQKKSFTSRNAVLLGDPVFDLEVNSSVKKPIPEYQSFSPLPGTNKEIKEINKVLTDIKWTTSVFLKQQATEKNVKAVHAPDILHIATHGFFSTDKVRLSKEAKKDFLFYSGLVLAGANQNLENEAQEIQDDGILTAYEVMNLNLTNTHLVVLSACETGLGKIENGEGVYGLQRSFLQAGARNILISLWKVDDRTTQELMIKFYHYLFQQQSIREALRNAQLDQLKKLNNPVGWGGFILVGTD